MVVHILKKITDKETIFLFPGEKVTILTCAKLKMKRGEKNIYSSMANILLLLESYIK